MSMLIQDWYYVISIAGMCCYASFRLGFMLGQIMQKK